MDHPYEDDILAWSKRQGALLRRIAAGEQVNYLDLVTLDELLPAEA